MLPAKYFNSLARVIENEPHLAIWLRRHQREAALTRAIRTHLPRLIADQVRVTDSKGGQLELTVPSGALATAVRQRIPELLATLMSLSHDFNGIRVRVQPLIAQKSPQMPPSRRPPPTSPSLQALAQDLPDGQLKTALFRLIRHR